MKEKVSALWSLIKSKWWYLILFLASTTYVIDQRNSIGPLSTLTVQNLIFYIWLILLLLPLFSEMEFMGIKVKKEVEKATKEVKDSVSELKMQVMDLRVSSSSNNALTQNFYGDMPSRLELAEAIKEQQPNKAGEESTSKLDALVTDESVYLFKVRFTIESALRSFCERFGNTTHISLNGLLELAVSSSLLDRKTADYTRQIFNICNRSIHGEIISEEYIAFVRRVLPKVLKQINSITSRMGFNYYLVCPKCHYSGYAEHENQCPACGFVSDE